MKPTRPSRPSWWPAYEARPGSVHAAAAQALFLDKLNTAVSPDAFHRLRTFPTDRAGGLAGRVQEWAAQQNIPFPCVIREAMAIADLAQRYPDTSVAFRGGWSSPRPPAEWLTALTRLNARIVDATKLDDVLAAVATPRELKEQELEIGARVRESRRARIRGDQPPRLTWGLHRARLDDPLRDSRRQFNERDIPKLRSERLELDRVGAAVGADPLRESEDHFIFRACNHWKARIQVAERMGYQRVPSWPDMDQHVEWTVRRLVGRERVVDIAERCHPRKTHQAVSRAVQKVITLLKDS